MSSSGPADPGGRVPPVGRWAPWRGGGRARRRMMPIGRWSLWRAGSRTEDIGQEKIREHQARQLLRRYGIVMRELLARESSMLSWRALQQVYRRLEARGGNRGGGA